MPRLLAYWRVDNPFDDIPNLDMFMHCQNLQFLSVKGAPLVVTDTEKIPLRQEMLDRKHDGSTPSYATMAEK